MARSMLPESSLPKPGKSKTQATVRGIQIIRSSFGMVTCSAAPTSTTFLRPWIPDKLFLSRSCSLRQAQRATYTSKWMLQTPEGGDFGVGQYNAPFYAEIVVSDKDKPGYAITSVEYNVVRDPATGCPANVTYTTYATLTSNGPIEIQYQWLLGKQRDTVLEKPKTLNFTEAGSQTISHESKLHLGNTPGDQRWKAIIIVDPYYKEYPSINFNYDCGSY